MNLQKIVFFISMLCTLCACQTVAGIGKDLQAGGEELERAATS